jgi:FtsZ-binding cell division protein ZapB
MTIDELHNKMANLYGYDRKLPIYIKDAVDMLRQQQAKIESLQEHNTKLVDDLFAERKEVIRLEAEIEQLKALAISLSPNSNLIYTKVSEK